MSEKQPKNEARIVNAEAARVMAEKADLYERSASQAEEPLKALNYETPQTPQNLLY